MSRSIVMSVGEHSGDIHGAHLAAALRHGDPAVSLSGMGGAHMRASGVEIFHDPTEQAIIGFIDVIKNLGYFKKLFSDMLRHLDQVKPDALIVIDYPGFNLRLAQKAHERGIKVYYYITPQVWAWAPKRIEKMRAVIDHLFVVFPFEEALFRSQGLPVSFVGHPLLDTIPAFDTAALPRALNAEEPLKIAVLPGSRLKEVMRHTALMIEACKILHRQYPQLECSIIQSPTLSADLYKPFYNNTPFPVHLINGDDRHKIIRQADFAFVCSGTATLETALIGTPMVMVYHVALINWIVGKLLVKIPHLALVNVVAGKEVVAECVQFNATPEKLAAHAQLLLENPAARQTMREEFAHVRASLGEPGAACRTAEKILSLILSLYGASLS